jgi:hypothetical protein
MCARSGPCGSTAHDLLVAIKGVGWFPFVFPFISHPSHCSSDRRRSLEPPRRRVPPLPERRSSFLPSRRRALRRRVLFLRRRHRSLVSRSDLHSFSDLPVVLCSSGSSLRPARTQIVFLSFLVLFFSFLLLDLHLHLELRGNSLLPSGFTIHSDGSRGAGDCRYGGGRSRA